MRSTRRVASSARSRRGRRRPTTGTKQLDGLRNELKDQESILSEAKRLEKESA